MVQVVTSTAHTRSPRTPAPNLVYLLVSASTHYSHYTREGTRSQPLNLLLSSSTLPPMVQPLADK